MPYDILYTLPIYIQHFNICNIATQREKMVRIYLYDIYTIYLIRTVFERRRPQMGDWADGVTFRN